MAAEQEFSDQLAQCLALADIWFQQKAKRIMATMLKSAPLELYVLRLLRCCQTGRYFKDGAWTEDPSDATCFAAEIDAVRTCIVNNLQNVELVLSTPGTYVDVVTARIR